MQAITENLITPLAGRYDVIVAGGGIAGVTAAVAAARNGAKVLLIEKSILFGGLATIGLINYYEPICDGKGRIVSRGMALELLRLSIRYGGDTLPDEWRLLEDNPQATARCSTRFSPTLFALALDEWLSDAAVNIILDTVIVRAVMQGTHCEGVIVENKTGRMFYSADIIIDATGDADILANAGVPCVVGQNYMTYSAHVATRLSAETSISGGNMLSIRARASVGSNLHGNGHPDGVRFMSGITAADVTEFVLTGRRMLLDKVRHDERMSRELIALPSMAQFRTTRHLKGVYDLTELDRCCHFEDSIGTVGDFLNRSVFYEIPYRCLYHDEFDNLLTAGRSISASDYGWDISRVIPTAAITGQAAGTAAALAIKSQCKALRELSVKNLQKILTADGMLLHY